jgi:hypothetical protein
MCVCVFFLYGEAVSAAAAAASAAEQERIIIIFIIIYDCRWFMLEF